MKFLIGLTTGLILAWGSPKVLQYLSVKNLPEDPADYTGPKYITWKNGELQ